MLRGWRYTRLGRSCDPNGGIRRYTRRTNAGVRVVEAFSIQVEWRELGRNEDSQISEPWYVLMSYQLGMLDTKAQIRNTGTAQGQSLDRVDKLMNGSIADRVKGRLTPA